MASLAPLALALAGTLAARGVVPRFAVPGEHLGGVGLDHVRRSRGRRRRLLAGLQPRDRLAGVPGRRAPPRHAVEDHKAEPAEPDHQRQQRERRDDEQRGDAERHPEGGEEAAQQADAHRLQGHVDHRHDQPEQRREQQVGGDVEGGAGVDQVVEQRVDVAAGVGLRDEVRGDLSLREPGDQPLDTEQDRADEDEPDHRAVDALAARLGGAEQVQQRDHEGEEREAAQRGRGEQLAGGVVDRPVLLGLQPRERHRAALVEDDRDDVERRRADRREPGEPLPPALAIDDLAPVHRAAQSASARCGRPRAGLQLDAVGGRADRDVIVVAADDPRDPLTRDQDQVEHWRGEADQGLEAGAGQLLLRGRRRHPEYSAALVEEEAGQRALDHLLGHPLGDLEIAGAHRDVVEGHDPDQALAVEHRKPPDPMLDHQRGRLLEIHLRLAGDQGPGRVLGDRLARRPLLGERADGEVAVRDHRGGLTLRVADDDRADGVVAHQLGDREHLGVGARRDHARGHDLAQLHERTISGRIRSGVHGIGARAGRAGKLPAVRPPALRLDRAPGPRRRGERRRPAGRGRAGARPLRELRGRGRARPRGRADGRVGGRLPLGRARRARDRDPQPGEPAGGDRGRGLGGDRRLARRG